MAIANDHFLCVKRPNGTVLKLRGNTAVPYTGRYIAFKVGGVTRYVTCSTNQGGALKCSKGGITLYANNYMRVDIEVSYRLVRESRNLWDFTLYAYTVSFLDGGFTENAGVDVIVLNSNFYKRQDTLFAGTSYIAQSNIFNNTAVGSGDPSKPPTVPISVNFTVFGTTLNVYNVATGTGAQSAHFTSEFAFDPSSY